MGRFENENREIPMQAVAQPTKGGAARDPMLDERPAVAGPVRAAHTNFLRKGAGLQRNMMLRQQQRTQRRVNYGQQRSLLLGGGFGEQQRFGLQDPLMQQQSGIESRLLSKPPLKHWGYEAAIVMQADIDQAPNFKRHITLRTRRATKRIHRVRRGVAWDIPVYNKSRHEKGGLSWTVPLDGDFYTEVKKPKSKKPSKAKTMLHRFTSGVKRLFKRKSSKSSKAEVRQQKRLIARKKGEPYVTRSSAPPQAPEVEKRRARRVTQTTSLDAPKDLAFVRAPTVAATASTPKAHSWHMSEIPLFRQAPAVDDEKTTTAPKSKAHTMHEEHHRVEHVHTG